jgi:hypothetical protein
MPILVYVVLILVLVILYYGYPRRDTSVQQPEKEEQKEVHFTKVPTVSVIDFSIETESMYRLRCRKMILHQIHRFRLPYKEVEESGWFVIHSSDPGSPYVDEILIKPIYDQLQKRIVFETKFTTLKIPDHNLAAAAQLVNRINNELTFKGFGLDYVSHAIYFKSALFVGNNEIDSGQVKFYLNNILTALKIKPFIERIIDTNEEPELLATDYLNTATYHV